eukprot:2130060-Prymnesium_polylepis.1
MQTTGDMRQSTWQMRQGKVTCYASHTSICETKGCSAALETAFRMTLPVHVFSRARDCTACLAETLSLVGVQHIAPRCVKKVRSAFGRAFMAPARPGRAAASEQLLTPFFRRRRRPRPRRLGRCTDARPTWSSPG